MPTPTTLCLAAAAATPLLAPPATAAATPLTALARANSCTAEGGTAFPLATRIHGGPETYAPGGGAGVWYVDLTNTTDRPCTGVHPVVVLADEERALRTAQPRLEFYADGRPHPVRFETTDEDELVGAFADDAAGFAGFSVGPGRTVTVKVRLTLAEDAVPNEVTATAAVVQRQDDDGEWVGRSNDYRFTVRDSPRDPADPEGTADPTAAPASPPASGAPTGPADPSARPRTDRFPLSAELASTGLASLPTLLAAGAALLLAAGAAVMARSRGRR
ncbi:hypothetical protein [Streptomyces sp. NPDC005017]|uniref:hypothetical protein n=1 Tax=Streptomyces sp. NPDC005017 TaxID=3364706 RepID=UPI0036C84EC6